jgi:hypothetical protein
MAPAEAGHVLEAIRKDCQILLEAAQRQPDERHSAGQKSQSMELRCNVCVLSPPQEVTTRSKQRVCKNERRR